jgi:PleD family two-component response regulator
MILGILDQLRSIRFSELNLLELLGVWGVGTLVLFGIIRLRDGFSAQLSRKKKGAKKKTNSAKIDRAAFRDLPRGDETVLIVDDDPGVLRAHARLISKFGYTVERATGGQEAVDFIKNSHADIIVLDLLMPGMDGI